MDLFGGQDARGALTTAISKASSNATEDVEEKINLTFIEEESSMEQKVEEMRTEVEKEDADVSHESMEYIEPSSLAIDTDDVIRVYLANKTEELENSPIDANLPCKSHPIFRYSPKLTSQLQPHLQIHPNPSPPQSSFPTLPTLRNLPHQPTATYHKTTCIHPHHQ